MMKWSVRMLLVMLCCWCSAVVATQRIDSVRMSKAPDFTRLVFDLQGPLDHTVDKLSNPDRIVVDLTGASLEFNFATLDLGNTPIREIRTGQHAADKVRVVLSHTDPSETKGFDTLAALGIEELISVSDQDEELPTLLGAPPVLPLTVFVRADGTVAHVLIQPMDTEQDVLDAVSEHLGVTA